MASHTKAGYIFFYETGYKAVDCSFIQNHETAAQTGRGSKSAVSMLFSSLPSHTVFDLRPDKPQKPSTPKTHAVLHAKCMKAHTYTHTHTHKVTQTTWTFSFLRVGLVRCP